MFVFFFQNGARVQVGRGRKVGVERTCGRGCIAGLNRVLTFNVLAYLRQEAICFENVYKSITY